MASRTVVEVPFQRDPTILNKAAGKALTAERYFNAGCFLKGMGNLARFADGTTWPEHKLYEMAIEVDATLAPAYINLAQVLPSGELANVAGGQWTGRMLYAKAIELDPTEVEARVSLAHLLGPEEKVCISGVALSRCQLCIQAMCLNTEFAPAYLHLSHLFANTHAKVELPGGQLVGSEELFAKATELDPSCLPKVLPSEVQIRFLPMCLKGVPVLKALSERDTYVVDNLQLQAPTRGIGYRMSMDSEDLDQDESMTANWGTIVRGQNCGDWLKVEVRIAQMANRAAAKGGC